MVKFICDECLKEFEADWCFGDEVQCPHCRTVWETDYDIDGDDEISGPWLEGRVREADDV